MSWITKLQSTEIQQNPVEVARASLRKLSEQGIRIPAQVAGPIIEAHKAGDLRRLNSERERQFWTAYGTLNSKIKPAEDAKNYYRRSFYVILTVLLLLQLYYSASLAVQTRLIDVNSTLASQESAKAAATPESDSKKVELDRERKTYLHLTQYLMGFPRFVLGHLYSPEVGRDPGSNEDRPEVVAIVELDLATSFAGKFLLPVLYGMLGAIAFVLRRLSDDTPSPEAMRDPRNRYSLRVPIGALSGLAAGWLLQPAAGTLAASLSPFALAFVAGYSAELVFAAMDRIVAAFTTPQSQGSSGKGGAANGSAQDAADSSDSASSDTEQLRGGAANEWVSPAIPDDQGLSSRALANRDA